MKTMGPAGAMMHSFGQSALRQPIFTLLLILPLMMGLFIRLVIAILNQYLPELDPTPWIPLILAVTATFPAYLYGILASLMLLDEKDRDLLPAYLITPVNRNSLIYAKLLPAVTMAAIGTPVCIILSGLSSILPNGAPIVAGLAAAPLCAFYGLFILRLSGNKVQALTFAKVSGSLLIAPVGLALLETPWRFLFLFFPGTPMVTMLIEGSMLLWFIPALLYPGLLIWILWKPTRKSYFT